MNVTMSIKLSAPYQGKLTDRQIIGPGIVEVSLDLGQYLLENRPDIAEDATTEALVRDAVEKVKEQQNETPEGDNEDGEVDDSLNLDSTEPSEELDGDSEDEEVHEPENLDNNNDNESDGDPVSNDPPTEDPFFCCGKSRTNVGGLRLHRKAKSCPFNEATE